MNTKKKRARRLERWQIFALLLMLCDFAAVHLSYFAALWIRFDCRYTAIPAEYLRAYTRFITPYTVVLILIFMWARLYRLMWRSVSYDELFRASFTSVSLSVLHVILITLIFTRMPISYCLFGGLLQLLCILVPRFSIRLFLFLQHALSHPDEGTERVMIIGAGQAGQMLLRDITIAKEIRDRVVCFIDDDPNKRNRFIEDIPIVGGRDEILSAVEKYRITKILFAIPSATAEQKRDILSICNETGCELKQLPGLYQLVLGEVTVSAMRDVSVEDLLGRDPIRADLREVFESVHGKRILITGGAGRSAPSSRGRSRRTARSSSSSSIFTKTTPMIFNWS